MRPAHAVPTARMLAVAAALVAALAGPGVPGAAASGPVAHMSIVGGTPVPAGAYPFAVAVLDDTRAGAAAPVFEKQVCGGSVIAPTIVLSAGHCVVEHGRVTDPGALHVLVGREELDGTGGEIVDVKRVIPDPYYDEGDIAPDLSLLQLAKPVSVAPIPIGDARAGLREGQKALAVGWGNIGNDTYPNRLLQAQLPMWNSKRCGAFWDAQFQPGLMLCASSPFGGADACDGDSGGPLAVRDAAGTLRLFGVVSFGAKGRCGRPRVPGVFAWVASPFLRTWVVRRSAALEAGNPDETPPVVSALAIVAGRVSYTVNEAAEVAFQLVRAAHKRLSQVSTALVQRSPGGPTGFRLPRALRGRSLPAGRYRLRAFAHDEAGNRSRVATAAFTVR